MCLLACSAQWFEASQSVARLHNSYIRYPITTYDCIINGQGPRIIVDPDR